MSEELLARLRTTAGNPAICKEAAATIERLSRERDEFRSKLAETCGKWQASEVHAEAELTKAREALEWYAEKATAMNRYMNATPPKPDAMVSVATELALDNGRRAALPPKPEEPTLDASAGILSATRQAMPHWRG
jgi:hypothetical protein